MKRIVILLFFSILGISPETYSTELQIGVTGQQGEKHQENYVPGMGDIMGATQMRHSKLWFAGISKNWELASYELDEIREGLDDAVKYHPVFKKDAPIGAILEKYTAQPLNDIESAISAKDAVKLRKSFDILTKACNDCHQAASQRFIVIKRPSVWLYSNQEFTVKESRLNR